MMNPITRWLIIGLIISGTAAVGLFAYQNQGLRADKKLLDTQLTDANTKVKAQAEAITTLETAAKANEKAHTTLLAKISTTKNLLTKHEQTIRTLEQQNEALKTWSNTRLPDPVIRLRQRPALTGSENYQSWLSERDALPITGIQSADQR